MSRIMLVLLMASALALGACGKRTKPDQGAQAVETGAGGASSSGADSGTAGVVAADGEDAPGPQEGLLQRRIVYFDFDSSEIRGDGTDIIAAHAKYLSGNNSRRVRLEGHTDERGSREYNIGLGERRAQAVRRALMLQGATDSQITTVSYGEERPASVGSDESAWSQNRRVEIVYLN